MDDRLIAWARAVKSRRRWAKRPLPVLWLFSDPQRLPDPRAAIARLPKGLCGVVLRAAPGADPGLAREVAVLCRGRRLALAMAGDARLAHRLGAGLHLRAGRRPGVAGGRPRFATSSAHSLAELRRARRAGARVIFLSPCFPTESHPGRAALGPIRWRAVARMGGGVVLALGGIDGCRVRLVSGRWCGGAAAIGALA
jgi:thiamine-phosphate pyrophosphorylase